RLAGAESEPGVALPPALLDGALRACHWVGRQAPPRRGELAIPFSLGALELFEPLPPSCWAHAISVGRAGEVERFELTICDGEGRVLARLTEFAGRLPGASAEPKPRALPASSEDEGGPRFYAPSWAPAPIAPIAPIAPSAAGGREAATLVLVGASVALELAVRDLDSWEWVICVADPAALRSRQAELAAAESLDVVFVAGLGQASELAATSEDLAAVTDQLEPCCFAVLELLRAAEAGELRGPIRCVVVHARDDDQSRPELGALAGFARSAGAGLARFELLSLGVDVELPERTLAEAVHAELRAGGRASGQELRLSPSGTREQRTLEPVEEAVALTASSMARTAWGDSAPALGPRT
ncbi:polyketide synthase dehydratase domain-containing protein, partial [Enhygromyxa salina]|uniref:polyketide synthase dehydratase domain-containing protein n=1 Tax=Enhygromyxa salina TaxID=215803 RepID=UPI0011BAB781